MMTKQQPLTTGRIMLIALGILFLTISLAMIFGPSTFQAGSGEEYIRLMLQIILGSGMLYFGLFPRKTSESSQGRKA